MKEKRPRFRGWFRGRSRWLPLSFAAVLVMVLANSCAAWLGGQSQSLYKPLDTSQVVITSVYPDAGVEDFVREALGEAISRYGQPRVPIHRVEVKAIDSKYAYTVLEDEQQGLFAIYMSRHPSEYGFWGLLAHETSHLLNAQFFDCYAEGLANLFGQEMLALNGLDRKGWEEYFNSNVDPFYSTTYFMVRELDAVIDADALRTLLKFTTDLDRSDPWMLVDINNWVESLSPEMGDRVRTVVTAHYNSVKNVIDTVDERYDCLAPK
ncbi:MAG: hypothetical protein AAFX95_14990 [Cyanobacteria bacterium J06639_16]